MEKDMDKERYFELCRKIESTAWGKDSRKLHKQLKEYNDGLPFVRRYPYVVLVLNCILPVLSLLFAIYVFMKQMSGLR